MYYIEMGFEHRIIECRAEEVTYYYDDQIK